MFAGVYRLSLAGSNENASADGDLDITDDRTIIGFGADATVIDGRAIERVLQIGTNNNGGQQVEIEGVTIRLANMNGGGGT